MNYVSDDTVWTEKTNVGGCLIQYQREMACSHRSKTNEGRETRNVQVKLTFNITWTM